MIRFTTYYKKITEQDVLDAGPSSGVSPDAIWHEMYPTLWKAVNDILLNANLPNADSLTDGIMDTATDKYKICAHKEHSEQGYRACASQAKEYALTAARDYASGKRRQLECGPEYAVPNENDWLIENEVFWQACADCLGKSVDQVYSAFRTGTDSRVAAIYARTEAKYLPTAICCSRDYRYQEVHGITPINVQPECENLDNMMRQWVLIQPECTA